MKSNELDDKCIFCNEELTVSKVESGFKYGIGLRCGCGFQSPVEEDIESCIEVYREFTEKDYE